MLLAQDKYCEYKFCHEVYLNITLMRKTLIYFVAFVKIECIISLLLLFFPPCINICVFTPNLYMNVCFSIILICNSFSGWHQG